MQELQEKLNQQILLNQLHQLKIQHERMIENQFGWPIEKQKQIVMDKRQFPNPQFQATIKRHIGNQGLSLFYYDQGLPIYWRKRFNQSCFVYRYQENSKIYIDFVPEEQAIYGLIPHQEAQLLMRIKLVQQIFQKPKKYYNIIPQPITELQNSLLNCKRMEKKIFKYINNSQKQNNKHLLHRIQKGQEYRFGLQNLKVVELNLNIPEVEKEQNQDACQLFVVDFQRNDKEVFCKFCLMNDNNVQNPLFQPCKCRGSCQFVHVQCLREWLNYNLVKQQNQSVTTYYWTRFQCEICKYNYPSIIKYKENVLRIAQIQNPNEPHIIFQRIKQCQRKKIFIVKGKNNVIKIGRTNQNEFRIDSNTVSRNHAVIVFKDGNFFIEDLGSKFGTLLRIKNQVRVQGKMMIQVGDASIRFDLVNKRKGKQQAWQYQN